MRNIRFGIVGCGNIAGKFAEDLALVEDATLEAVASRSLKKAKAFAKEHQSKHAYGSYAEIFQDSDVDIVYIATPHDSHAELAIEAMRAGRAVICEKPLGVNSKQVASMIKTSQDAGVFLMEALWTRFNPAIIKVLELLNSGAIGEVNFVNADFLFFKEFDGDHRLFDPALAGGSILDVCIYPIFLAYQVFGNPEEVLAMARKYNSGPDFQAAVILKFKKGLASLASGIQTDSQIVGKIEGTKGSIVIDARWHETEGFWLHNDKGSERFDIPKKGKGYTHEIKECISCLRAGKGESALWSHQNSIDLIAILDEVRNQCGVKYPFE